MSIEERVEQRVKKELEPIDVEEMVRDLLNGSQDFVEVGNAKFEPSKVLEELDPTAFREEVLFAEDALIKDGKAEEIDGDLYSADKVQEIRDEEEEKEEEEVE